MNPMHSEGTHTRSSQGSHAPGTAASVMTGLIASVLALHIAFVVFEANQGNEFVLLINDAAESLSLGMEPVFTPESAKAGVALNYGLAAVLYLGIGQFFSRLLHRR